MNEEARALLVLLRQQLQSNIVLCKTAFAELLAQILVDFTAVNLKALPKFRMRDSEDLSDTLRAKLDALTEGRLESAQEIENIINTLLNVSKLRDTLEASTHLAESLAAVHTRVTALLGKPDEITTQDYNEMRIALAKAEEHLEAIIAFSYVATVKPCVENLRSKNTLAEANMTLVALGNLLSKGTTRRTERPS
jgi:hypothetical protein